jgi:hypothetical protein
VAAPKLAESTIPRVQSVPSSSRSGWMIGATQGQNLGKGNLVHVVVIVVLPSNFCDVMRNSHRGAGGRHSHRDLRSGRGVGGLIVRKKHPTRDFATFTPEISPKVPTRPQRATRLHATPTSACFFATYNCNHASSLPRLSFSLFRLHARLGCRKLTRVRCLCACPSGFSLVPGVLFLFLS